MRIPYHPKSIRINPEYELTRNNFFCKPFFVPSLRGGKSPWTAGGNGFIIKASEKEAPPAEITLLLCGEGNLPWKK
jgi:hypothetical protein